MSGGRADTSGASTGNVFVEVLWTTQKVASAKFNDDLSKKFISIVSTATAIYVPNGTFIYDRNDTLILHEGANYLISTAQDRRFGVAIHDVAKRHGGKQYIHADNWVIPMNFEKALTYGPTQ